MENKKRMVFALVLCVFLVAADQLVKLLTVSYRKNGSELTLIPGVLSLTYVENRGAAFGVLQDGRYLFYILTAAMLAVFVYCYIRLLHQRSYRLLRILCVTLSAGGIGNLLDRIFRGYVVDMIYFKLIDFPVFNVADCYITVSVVLLMLAVLFLYKEDDFSFLIPGKDRKKDKGSSYDLSK